MHYLVDVEGVRLSDKGVCDSFFWAARSVHVLQFLVERLGFNARHARNNKTFKWAAFKGHVDGLRFLVERLGLDAGDARTDDNYAFQWAVKNGHIDVLRFLVERLSFDARTFARITPFSR
jgi:ankyrin repeat protein